MIFFLYLDCITKNLTSNSRVKRRKQEYTFLSSSSELDYKMRSDYIANNCLIIRTDKNSETILSSVPNFDDVDKTTKARAKRKFDMLSKSMNFDVNPLVFYVNCRCSLVLGYLV